MNIRTINTSELLSGYDAVSALYPYIPSLTHWRAWEYAAYQHHRLDGRILDLGCGDGRFFKLIWPHAANVIGLDMSPCAAELARQSGIYRIVHTTPAHRVPEPDASFDHVFANCSLEHMEDLDAVLIEIQRCLKPDGTLLCSVVTDLFIQWSLIPKLVTMAGFEEAAKKLHKDSLNYHNLTNPLSVDEWVVRFKRYGLIAEEHIPILPKHNSGIFLLMDNLWHIKKLDGGEIGDVISSFMASNPNISGALRKIFSALIEMETDRQNCSGAVFLIRKPR